MVKQQDKIEINFAQALSKSKFAKYHEQVERLKKNLNTKTLRQTASTFHSANYI